jgi:4-hydroxy-4-methyl-2-oxoglutarate aldolase
MTATLSSEHLQALRQLDTCSVANAIDTFKLRLRNEGYADSSIRCFFPRLAPMVGYAVTLKIRSAAPPLTGHPYVDRTDWWSCILGLPEPRVAVIQDMDAPPGAGAFIGGIHSNILHGLGCVGVVTNGAVRDLPAVEDIPFQLFAGNVAVSHAYVHIVEIGCEVVIGGLKINAGDLLHGDQHGLLSVPRNIAAEIPAVAAKLAEKENKLIALCRSRNFTLEQLSEAVKP